MPKITTLGISHFNSDTSTEVAQFDTVKTGLRELVNDAYSMKQNLEARADTPVLPDGTNLWGTWLDSKNNPAIWRS